jgi:AraC family transcriptional regulator
MAPDSSGGTIAHWNHGELHDVVEPMTDHVIVTYIGILPHLKRRRERSLAIGATRSRVVTIIPDGTSAQLWELQPVSQGVN